MIRETYRETTEHHRTIVRVEVTESPRPGDNIRYTSWEFHCDLCGSMESGLTEYEARWVAHICQRQPYLPEETNVSGPPSPK